MEVAAPVTVDPAARPPQTQTEAAGKDSIMTSNVPSVHVPNVATTKDSPMVPAWVTQGRTEHHAFWYIGRTKMVKGDSDDKDEEEHVLIRWVSTNELEWVAASSVREAVEGETRRRRCVKPIYTIETPKKKKKTNQCSTLNREKRKIVKRGRTRPSKQEPFETTTVLQEKNNDNIQDEKKVESTNQTAGVSDAVDTTNSFGVDSMSLEHDHDDDEEWEEAPVRCMPPPPPRKRESSEENGDMNGKTERKDESITLPAKATTTSSSSPVLALGYSSEANTTEPNSQSHGHVLEPSLQSEGSVSEDEWGRKDERKINETTTTAPISGPAELGTDGTSKDGNVQSTIYTSTSPSPAPLTLDPRLSMDNYDISDKETFPTNLFRLLQDANELGIDQILSWEADGKTFRMHCEKEFLRLLTRLSANKKVISFRNTLGQFNFQCVEYGEHGRAYQHISAFPPENGTKETQNVLFYKDASLDEIGQIKKRRPASQTRHREMPKDGVEKPKTREILGSKFPQDSLISQGKRNVEKYSRVVRASTKAATAESLEKSEYSDPLDRRKYTVPHFVDPEALQSRFRIASLDDLMNANSKKRKLTAAVSSTAKKSRAEPPRRQKRMDRRDNGKRLRNGCVLPEEGSTYQLEDGTWAKPAGSIPSGLFWDGKQGVWAPKGKLQASKKQKCGDIYSTGNDSSLESLTDDDHDGKKRRKRITNVISDRRRSAVPQSCVDHDSPHRLVIHTHHTEGFRSGHSTDESVLEDHTVIRLLPSGKHHTLRTSPFFPTFLMFKKHPVFKGKFKAKTKANPTGTIGGDNEFMKGVNKDNFAKILRLLHRERSEDESSSQTMSSVSSGDSTVPAVAPMFPEMSLKDH
ncbi:HSF-type DNA-binding protein [Nitzschia inconspicua]|uniref:HSF-type DNA-binding protein n=1 Tax=Nitzschia inconspicua TaxID=303405 RepID=A0A9K3M3Q1_9STRA|nr:HSF-type DNA-binding protein [Nitzschia inconspicua]